MTIEEVLRHQMGGVDVLVGYSDSSIVDTASGIHVTWRAMTSKIGFLKNLKVGYGERIQSGLTLRYLSA